MTVSSKLKKKCIYILLFNKIIRLENNAFRRGSSAVSKQNGNYPIESAVELHKFWLEILTTFPRKKGYIKHAPNISSHKHDAFKVLYLMLQGCGEL